MTPLLRPLGPDDAEAYLAFRNGMLVASPLAFLATPEDDFFRGDPARLRELLRTGASWILGAFDPGLVGAVGVARDERRKIAHKAHVWGMYVAPEKRRLGLARSLLRTAILHARSMDGIRQVTLSVSDAAPEARALYASEGFTLWGTEPDALLHEGALHAEHHMVLQLAR